MYLGTVLSMYMDGDQNPVCVGVCDNGAGARGGLDEGVANTLWAGLSEPSVFPRRPRGNRPF
jgi:hypothetical protein